MIAGAIKKRLMAIAQSRGPDAIIGGEDNPYLLRWFVIPRNPVCNVYLHLFLRSDDDRALHDHPWLNCSVLLEGSYVEHQIRQGGVHMKIERRAGDYTVRWSGRLAHRIELIDGPCWTVFITGPRYRQWGFHCPDLGWVHWRVFTKPNKPGEIGRGCE